MRQNETLWLVVASVLLALAVAACAPGDDPSDGEDDSFVGDKADGFCVEEGTPEGDGVLRLVNDRTVKADDLDQEAGLARTPAENIVAERPFASLTELDQVPFVGPIACQKLKAYARQKGFIGGGAALACQVDNQSGNSQTDLTALGDPVAKLVLQGDGCPTSYAQVQAKLRQTDKQGCEEERDGLK